MKINDVSNNDEIVIDKEKTNKKKMILIFSLIILLAAIIVSVIFVIDYLHKRSLYNKYAKPLIEYNDMLTKDLKSETEFYTSDEHPELPNVYAVSVSDANQYVDSGVVLAQVLDPTYFDMKTAKPITKRTYNLHYQVYPDDTAIYYITIKDEDKDEYNSTHTIWFTPDMEYIKGADKELYFDANKADIKDRLDKLFDFFGKDNFCMNVRK